MKYVNHPATGQLDIIQKVLNDVANNMASLGVTAELLKETSEYISYLEEIVRDNSPWRNQNCNCKNGVPQGSGGCPVHGLRGFS